MPAGGARYVITGVDDVVTKIQSMRLQGRFATFEATKALADELLEESLTLVPVESGALLSTGQVVETGGGYPIGFSKTYSVTFGDESVMNAHDRPVDYAVYVHEILTHEHDVGQAKYLEEPALRLFAQAQSSLVQNVRARFKFVNVGGGFGSTSTFTGGV